MVCVRGEGMVRGPGVGQLVPCPGVQIKMMVGPLDFHLHGPHWPLKIRGVITKNN